MNGPLSEQDKMDLIERTYTMKNLKDSSYLIKVRDTFEYLDACSNDHKSKQEIAKEFRDIESVTGIPQKIADENEALIKRLNELLQSNNYQKNQYEITKLKNKVLNLTVQVPSYLFYQKRNDIEVGFVELSRYQKIPIISDEYEYDNNKGLSLSPKKKEHEFDNIF